MAALIAASADRQMQKSCRCSQHSVPSSSCCFAICAGVHVLSLALRLLLTLFHSPARHSTDIRIRGERTCAVTVLSKTGEYSQPTRRTTSYRILFGGYGKEMERRNDERKENTQISSDLEAAKEIWLAVCLLWFGWVSRSLGGLWREVVAIPRSGRKSLCPLARLGMGRFRGRRGRARGLVVLRAARPRRWPRNCRAYLCGAPTMHVMTKQNGLVCLGDDVVANDKPVRTVSTIPSLRSVGEAFRDAGASCNGQRETELK